jgi:membrane protease YdiL (CAAX protease family)
MAVQACPPGYTLTQRDRELDGESGPTNFEGRNRLIETAIFAVVALAITWGLAFWAHKAQTDRSAFVGLYLVLGFPAVLMIVAGAAFAITGSRIGVALLAVGLGLGLPLMPQFRKFLARYTPLDPQSRIDMVGLSVMLGIMGFLAVTAFTTPEPGEETAAVGMADLLLQVSLFVGLAFILTGTGIYRTLRQAAVRLGLRRIGPKGVGIAIASVLLMLIVSAISSLVTGWVQPDLVEDLEQVTNDMTANVQNPIGAVTLGLSAGIGEELLLRGAIQPRFGLVLTSLLFALLHTQYGLTFVLVGLFAIGMILGVLRNRYGTMAPIIAHALFNTLVVLAQSAA